jgi:predicted transcriptional regulator
MSQLDIRAERLAKECDINPSTLGRFLKGGSYAMRYDNLQRIVAHIREPTIPQDYMAAPASKFISKEVQMLSPRETVSMAINRMIRNEINQLPVGDENSCIGVFSVDTVRRIFGRNLPLLKAAQMSMKELKEQKLLDPKPSTFSPEEKISAIWEYLNLHYYALIEEDNKLKGVITRRSCLKVFEPLLNFGQSV